VKKVKKETDLKVALFDHVDDGDGALVRSCFANLLQSERCAGDNDDRHDVDQRKQEAVARSEVCGGVCVCVCGRGGGG
jgi:hypothetical protein